MHGQGLKMVYIEVEGKHRKVYMRGLVRIPIGRRKHSSSTVPPCYNTLKLSALQRAILFPGAASPSTFDLQTTSELLQLE